ncbi:hypothetical protein cce_1494 [Crocosphaera subtropica ATCC 51142]|uniref:CobW C-terminal domain-containing protein n=1 Tax=Crocosphaera subtropica (strain ATCC 51142 / BH68) TaxID=43989 RepID=B1WXA0_CROS5|nr:hypothetical protein [Crocosphaera subtropica]ACB50844.1 hypothetical protein cce_1494 [Crocosphaera subtropica ATCC 51142]
MITVIMGNISSGKTHLIKEKMSKATLPIIYWSPQTDLFPIDAIYLKSEFPHLSILANGEENKLRHLSNHHDIYIEVPWYLEIKSIDSFLKQLNCHRLALISKVEQKQDWQMWTDEIILNEEINGKNDLVLPNSLDLQIYRATLTGEVLDFSSLETFWLELIHGAYGEVIRIKGIFTILDGQWIYGEFLSGKYPKDFCPLNFPLNLEGRPQQFSGLEIVGRNLDKQAIADTLGEFCLSDEAIFYYQQQVKQSLVLEKEKV